MNDTPQLRDALHLSGSRPLFAFLAGLVVAGLVALSSLGIDTMAESRQVLFAAPLAGTDRTPAQIEDFADEVALAATLPEVTDRIQDRTGLVKGVSYTRQIERTASDTSLLVVAQADDIGTARTAAQQVGLESVRFVLEHQIARSEALERSLTRELETLQVEKNTLTSEAGDVAPTAAEERLSQLLFDAVRGDEEAGSVTQLRLELAQVEPLAARYRLLEQQEAQVTSELASAASDVGAANSALESIDTGTVLSELSTQEESIVPLIVQRSLLGFFATVLLFVIGYWAADKLRPRASPSKDLQNDRTSEGERAAPKTQRRSGGSSKDTDPPAKRRATRTASR